MRKEKRENETQIGNRNVLGSAAPPALSRLQLCSGERADLSQDPPWGLRAWPLSSVSTRPWPEHPHSLTAGCARSFAGSGAEARG